MSPASPAIWSSAVAHARLAESVERFACCRRANQRKRAVLQIRPVLVRLEQAGIDLGDLRQRAKALEIGVDDVGGVLDPGRRWRLEDDVQVVGGAETLEVLPERLE